MGIEGVQRKHDKNLPGGLLVYFQQLCNHPAHTLTTDDVKRYLEKCLKAGLSENTLHSRINALKFYYEKVFGREKFFFDIPRPLDGYLENRRPRMVARCPARSCIAALNNFEKRRSNF